MLTQAQVTIKKMPGGALFIGEDGRETPYLGRMVMEEVAEIFNTAASQVVMLFDVEYPDDWQSLVAADYEPGERPELCAVCNLPINLGQPFRPEHSRPGYAYAHAACDALELMLDCNVCRQLTRHRFIGKQQLVETLFLWNCGICENTRSGPAPA